MTVQQLGLAREPGTGDRPADGTRRAVAARHLVLSETFASGVRSEMHVVEDPELTAGHRATDLLSDAHGGQLLIALGVEAGTRDLIHYRNEEGYDAEETLARAVESLSAALDVVRGVKAL